MNAVEMLGDVAGGLGANTANWSSGTTTPDMVADSMSTFGKSSNRHDMYKRERLPLSMHSMELEWRNHPVAMMRRLILTNMQLAPWLFVMFCLTTLAVAPLVRLYGGGILSPLTYPLICFVCGLAAYYRFSVTGSFASAARRFVVPQGIAIVTEWTFSPAISRWWGAIPVVFAIVGVGYLADRVNTHYVQWITANLRLKREAVLRRRSMWALRFNWFALTREIAALRQQIQTLEAQGETEQAFILRRRAGELLELGEYPLGFLALAYVAILLFVGAPTTVLVLSGIGVSAALAFRRPLITMKLWRLIAEVNVHSFVSWFSWETKQEWINSPGMFNDQLSSRFRRLTQTVFSFVLVEIAFIPPVHLWGVGEMFTPRWLWTSEYHFFLNLLFPAFFLLCALIATGARPLWMHLEAVEWAEASDEIESTRHYWDAIVGRLQNSENKTERRHLWLGTHAEYGYPVLFDKQLSPEHFHIQGGSGSGKTSRVLTPLVAQLIRGGKGAIVIIDLKGERSQLEAARLEAKRSGRVFKHFTNVLGLSSYLFNAYQQISSKTMSFTQCVETIMESLRLNHGDGYGTRYFTIQSRQWLSRTIRNWPNLSSFEELYRKAASPEFFKNEAEMDRCREAIAVIQQVAEVTAMNWKPGSGESDQPLKDAIFMPDVVEEGQVIYFSLPAIGETSTVKEIANLVLYSAMMAAKNYQEHGGKEHTYLIIDEFQQMASEGFKLILRQARKFNLCLILANQSEADLMTRQANRLLDVVRANTQVKIYLAAEELSTIKMLEKASGVIAYAGIDGKLDYRPRLTVSDIRYYSGHSDYAICWITRDSGFSAYGGDWFGLRTDFHITEEEFEDRDSAPWPAATESTIVAQRTPDGARAFDQGTGAASSTGQGDDEAQGALFGVPDDSKWAKRLMDVYQRRYVGVGEGQ